MVLLLPRDNENGVEAGQADEDAVDGALHLRPAEDDDANEVAHQAAETDQVQEDARDDELKQDAEVTLHRT